jgi:hypothetical protein
LPETYGIFALGDTIENLEVSLGHASTRKVDFHSEYTDIFGTREFSVEGRSGDGDSHGL